MLSAIEVEKGDLLSLKSLGMSTDLMGPKGTNAANKISFVTSFSSPPT